MDDKKALLFGLLMVGCMVALFIFRPPESLKRNREAQTQSSTTSSTLPKSGTKCGEIRRSCEATASVAVPGCSEAEAERKLSAQLEVPLDNPGCADLKKQLEAGCEAGCAVDFTTLMTIRGKISFSGAFESSPGECTFSAVRGLSVKADCRRS